MLKHSYQKTLHLPKTKFPNRSNLTNTLNKLIPESSDELYSKQYNELLQNASSLKRDDVFVLHDGPPYANGDIHFGHSLNKILKDMINRHQLLFNQKYVWYKPGWDCHGLPIELKALETLKLNKSDLSPLKIRSIARKHATKQINLQMQQFQKLGIMANWNDKYLTLDPKYEINQLKLFNEMLNNGLIRRQKKPVYWGTETETALAEGELEYNEAHVSKSAYVKFPLVYNKEEFLRQGIPENTKLLIWTSTPWTLFSNRAICYNETFEYCLITKKEDNDEFLIVEKELYYKNISQMDPTYDVKYILKGSQLKDLQYTNPMYDLPQKSQFSLFHGNHVTNNQGTGLVHTAPGHGQDDYLIGLANSLEIYSPIDDKGNYILNAEWPALKVFPETLANKVNVLDPNTTKTILSHLQSVNALFHSHDYVHSYPYDWRSKKPVIIRSTPQWFADLSDIKPLALQSLESVKFQPARGINRLSSFIKSRNEWCISRQRYWGVPIPYFINKEDSNDILMNTDTTNHIIDVISKKGIDSWFVESENGSIEEWLPEKYKHLKDQYIKGKDTVDVWFDSGSSWQEITNWQNELGLFKDEPVKDIQADIYLEGSDQHRGWFQSSLLTKIGTSLNALAPYKKIITHGFTLDERGMKMSKSIGNTIAPIEMIEGNAKKDLPPLGVDGLRLLIASSNYSNDIVAGPVVMKHVGESLKKFRLTFKFLLGNLNKFNLNKDLLPFKNLRPFDKHILKTTNTMLHECTDLYKTYKFNKILTTIQFHMNNDLSALYFNSVKDSLYSDSLQSFKRKQIQTTLYHILDSYRSVMAPIIPIMVQEMWNHSPMKLAQQQQQQQQETPEQKAICNGDSPFTKPVHYFDAQMFENVNYEQELDVLKKFNKLYLEFTQSNPDITKTVKTVVNITHPKNITFDKEELADLLQVAKVNLKTHENDTIKTVDLEIAKSADKECGRCWNHNVEDHSKDLCKRCESVINETEVS